MGHLERHSSPPDSHSYAMIHGDPQVMMIGPASVSATTGELHELPTGRSVCQTVFPVAASMHRSADLFLLSSLTGLWSNWKITLSLYIAGELARP